MLKSRLELQASDRLLALDKANSELRTRIAELREQVAQRLATARAPASWAAMVRDAVQLDEADQRRSFGEALPPGLKWLGSS